MNASLVRVPDRRPFEIVILSTQEVYQGWTTSPIDAVKADFPNRSLEKVVRRFNQFESPRTFHSDNPIGNFVLGVSQERQRVVRDVK